MPAKPAAKTIRVVKNNIGTDDLGQYLKTFAYAVSSGKFDTHLDVLYRIIDDRVREYTGLNTPDDPATEKKLGRIKKLREPTMQPVAGNRYGVFGERYRGVVVEFQGYASSDYEDGSRKVRVLVVETGQSSLDIGTKLMPLAALMELPPKKSSDDSTNIEKI